MSECFVVVVNIDPVTVGAVCCGLVVIMFALALIGYRIHGRQLDPPEFTGDQGIDP